MDYFQKGSFEPEAIQKYANIINGNAAELVSVDSPKAEACRGLASWASWLYQQDPKLLDAVYKKAAETNEVSSSGDGSATFKQPWSQWLSTLAVAGLSLEAKLKMHPDGQADVALHMLMPFELMDRDQIAASCSVKAKPKESSK